MRAGVEAVGVRDVLAKCIGSSNPYNVVRATLNGLKALNSPSELLPARQRNVDEIFGVRNDTSQKNNQSDADQSLIGPKQSHRDTIRGLGLRRINHTVQLEDTSLRAWHDQ